MAYDIKVYRTHIEISPYKLGDNLDFEKNMSTYDKTLHKWNPLCYHVEDDILYIPKGISIKSIEKYFYSSPVPVYAPDDYDTIKSGEGLYSPKNIIQEDAIKFLCAEDNYSYTGRYSQLGLNLVTGDGKTYCSIYSVLKYKIKTIIITHQEKLKQQWVKTIKEMTSFPEDKIVDISGSNVIDSIMDGNTSGEIYVVNHQTLSSYARNHSWSQIRELFKKIKVGIKIIDESHKFFESSLMIDNFSNCYKTFYLTATFGRSDPREVRLYKQAFSSLVRFGEETINSEIKRRHTKFIICYFKSKPKNGIMPKVDNAYGFSGYRYIDYELKNSDSAILDLLNYILENTSHLSGKTLILSPKVESVEMIADYVRKITNKSVGVVHGSNSDETNQENLQKDIISSTIKSVGEGTDIKGLRVLINLEPIGSKIVANQVQGRLREYSPRDDTLYFYPVDTTIEQTSTLLKRILPTMKIKCKEIIHMTY